MHHSAAFLLLLGFLFLISFPDLVTGQSTTPVVSEDPVVAAVLEGAKNLLDKYLVDIEGNCLVDETIMGESVVGCLLCGLSEVASPTECQDLLITESTGEVCITSWRVGGCSCTVTLNGFWGSGSPYNPARTVALAIHEAASQLGVVPTCQVHPIDKVLEMIAREWWKDRTGWNCISSIGGQGHSGEGCLIGGQPDVGPSADCPNPISCTKEDWNPPLYRTDCDWRAGTYSFSSSGLDDTEYNNAAPYLANETYRLCVENGFIPACEPTPTPTPEATPTPTEAPAEVKGWEGNW